MKKFAALFILAVMLLGSCRKEIQPNPVDVSKPTTTTAVSATPSISNAAITNWFVKNPMGTHLSVDWKKARQATVNGVDFVTVPVKNITLSAGQQTGTKQASGLSASTTTTLTTFDPYHPPALYFFQDKNSGYPDSVRGIMMNFVPDDPTKEDGANKIWTGKLVEWNMQGDTLFYQHLTKSKVDGKYMQQLGHPAAEATTSVNSVGAKQTATVKINTIFGDIWDAISAFFQAIGYALGIPGYYPNAGGGGMIVTDWCAFLGGMFCGGGGGGASGGDGAGNTYNIIYSSYISGYAGYAVAQGTNWSIYVTTSGGGVDGSNPCSTSAITGKTIQQVDPGSGCNGSTIYVTSAMVVNSVCVNYNLNTDQQQWLNNNLGYFNALTDYLNNHPDLLYNYFNAVDFLDYSIGYLIENPDVTPSSFINQISQPEIVEDPSNVDWSTEPDNEVFTDPDPSAPAEYQQGTPWPTVTSVIPYSQFVPHRRDANGKDVNCLTLAREQIGKVGYTVSGYLPGSQTFQVNSPNGVNLSQTKEAITYIISALSNHIPVVAGVDAYPGSSNADGISDHFLVIDAMGTDAGGKYFHFLDNSTNTSWLGNSPNNKFYYNETTGIISGRTDSQYPANITGNNVYTVTQIRKSIKK